MELGTFGAVMGFAVEVAGQAEAAYADIGERAEGNDLVTLLAALRMDARRDRSAVEQARREHVTEMILEPIAGLRQADYLLETGKAKPGGDAEFLEKALLIEARDLKFYTDAAAKLPLPEVARLFRKIAKRKAESLARLEALAG